MRSFAIDEPGSPVRALYATLLRGISIIILENSEFQISLHHCQISVHCSSSFLILSLQLWVPPPPRQIRLVWPCCPSSPSSAGWRWLSSFLSGRPLLLPPPPLSLPPLFPPPSPLPSPPLPLPHRQALQHHTSSWPPHTWPWPPWPAPRTSPSPPSQG